MKEQRMTWTKQTVEELLEKMPADLPPYCHVSSPRGYYDKEKYKRTAAADAKHAAQREYKDPSSIEKEKI
jgi:hypothetical protein